MLRLKFMFIVAILGLAACARAPQSANDSSTVTTNFPSKISADAK